MNSAQRIIAKFGGQTRLAKLLGTCQSTVEYWASRGYIPAKWHQKILDVAAERGVSLSPIEFLVVAATGETLPAKGQEA